MGNRAQVAIYNHLDGSEVFIYSHHLGDGLADSLSYTLEEFRGNYSDPEKIAAYLLQAITPPKPSRLGFGISSKSFGVEHPTIELHTTPSEALGVQPYLSYELDGVVFRFTPKNFITAVSETISGELVDDSRYNRFRLMTDWAD
jgi:hypothetical protein